MENYFYLINKEKRITEDDFSIALQTMSEFNKSLMKDIKNCDVKHDLSGYYIYINNFSDYIDKFKINWLINLINLGYRPKLLSKDYNYGLNEDWLWLESFNINLYTNDKEEEKF